MCSKFSAQTTSIRDLLDMHIPRPHPDLAQDSESWGPRNLISCTISSDSVAYVTWELLLYPLAARRERIWQEDSAVKGEVPAVTKVRSEEGLRGRGHPSSQEVLSGRMAVRSPAWHAWHLGLDQLVVPIPRIISCDLHLWTTPTGLTNQLFFASM